MAAGHRSPTSQSRSADKNLEEAQSTGCLDLSNRNLNELPKAVDSYDLSDTVDANISKNRLTELPKQFCDFSLLEKLNCYHNSIRSLPESLSRLQYLTYLDVSRNQLSHLPPFLCHLQSLEVLIVSNNRLVSIPEEIGQLTALMHLDASCNEINVIPTQIGDATAMRILNLRKNLLQELPTDISRLKLKTLNFSCNKIQAIPLEFRFMESLEDLIIDNNPLISPPAQTCTKGRVHIIKYLHILAMREDKRRGVLAENNLHRNALQRSFQRDEKDSVRMRRQGIVSTDSGYSTDVNNRWPSTATIENGTTDENLPIHSPEVIREQQRAERHSELQKRIAQAELHSPSRSHLSLPTSASSMHPIDTVPGSISPLKLGPGANDVGEDIFARELSRQKQEYEQKKKRAEQIRSDARRSARTSGGVGSPPNQNTPNASPSVASVNSKPPQPPHRSLSANSPRSLLYSEQPSIRPSQLSLRQGSPSDYYHSEMPSAGSSKTSLSHTSPSQSSYQRRSLKETGENNSNGLLYSPGDSIPSDKSDSSSHDEEKKPMNDTVSRGRNPIASSDRMKKSGDTPSDYTKKKLRSRSSPLFRGKSPCPTGVSNSHDGSNDASKTSRSHLPTGKAGSHGYQAIKSQGRSKAPTLSTSSSTRGSTTPNSVSSANESSASKVKSTAGSAGLSDRTHTNQQSRLRLPQAAAATSRFGFQTPVTTKTPASSNNGRTPHEVNGHSLEASAIILQLKELIESRLKIKLQKDVMSELKDGVVLCHLANHIKPHSVSQIHVKSSAVPKLSMAKCKRNVENFLEACKRLGVSQDNLCSYSDLIEEKNPVPILKTIKSLLEIKLNNKPGNASQSNATPRSRTSSSNVPRSTTPTSSRRLHQPLHSFV